MLSFGIQPPHPTLFIKKIIKELNYYSTNYKIVGDFDFFVSCLKKTLNGVIYQLHRFYKKEVD